MKIVTAVSSERVWTLPPAEATRLQQLFPQHEVVNVTTRDERFLAFPDADILFLSQLKPDEFEVARRVRWIQSPAAGVASLLIPALRASQVVVTNARGIHGAPIAEHVIAVTIMLFRQLQSAVRRQVTHQWGKEDLSLFRMIHGQRLGIVGLGSIGTAIAEKAAALGMQVSAVRRNPDAPRPDSVSEVLPLSALHRLLEQSDVVVMSAPLTPETRGLFGETEFRRMKRDAVFVNIARGKVVQEDALVRVLGEGHLRGAALDVFEHEPLDPNSPLWDIPNVIITPHTSAFRDDYWVAAIDLFADNLRRFDQGAPLRNVVDKTAGY